jgi:hypothetical protein
MAAAMAVVTASESMAAAMAAVVKAATAAAALTASAHADVVWLCHWPMLHAQATAFKQPI